ncbi:MAG TPA: hypothetical protein VF433_10495 [Cellvibrio sp.]
MVISESLFSVEESTTPLFVDAYLMDGERWIFGSFWGSETTMQEFFARLTLSNHEQGLRSFTLQSATGERQRIFAGRVDDLTKVTGRTPNTSVLGSFCNVWIFDPALQKPDRTNGEAYIIGRPSESRAQMWLRAWASVQSLSQVPLLEHWRDEVMELLTANEWLKSLIGVGVQGYRIAIPAESFEGAISQGVKAGLLALDEDTTDVYQSSAPQGLLF